jgi:hypothetical protein
MAFPTVISSTGGTDSLPSLTHSIDRPPGYATGDMILWVVAFRTGVTVTDWDGLDAVVSVYDNAPRNIDLDVRYEVLTGGEGATADITLSVAREIVYSSYLIRGHNSAVDSAPASGEYDYTGNAPNPPSLTPSWGAKDTLWFAIVGYNDGRTTVNSYPSGYTAGRNDRISLSNYQAVGTGYRQLNASSEDPGAFSLSSAEEYVVCTVGIEPGSPVGPTAGGDPTIDGPPTDLSIFMEWTDSPDNTECYVHRATTEAGLASPSVGTRLSGDLGANATSYEDTSLYGFATEHYYLIEWADGTGSTYSNVLNVKSCYAKPSNIIWDPPYVATSISFFITPGAGSEAAHHQIFVYEDGDYLRTVMLEPGTYGFTNIVEVDGLKPGSLYDFKCQAYDATFNSGVGAFSTLYTESRRTVLSAIVTAFEFEVGDAQRRAVVTAFELEVGTAPRYAVVTAFEFEIPDADRYAVVSAFELEVPDAPVARQALVTAFEFEIPDADRKAVVTAFELETPFADRKAIVTAYEFEIPDADRKAVVTAFELETPGTGRQAVVTAFEFEAPNVVRTTSQPGYPAIAPFPSPPEHYASSEEAEFRRRVEDSLVDIARIIQHIYEKLS